MELLFSTGRKRCTTAPLQKPARDVVFDPFGIRVLDAQISVGRSHGLSAPTISRPPPSSPPPHTQKPTTYPVRGHDPYHLKNAISTTIYKSQHHHHHHPPSHCTRDLYLYPFSLRWITSFVRWHRIRHRPFSCVTGPFLFVIYTRSVTFIRDTRFELQLEAYAIDSLPLTRLINNVCYTTTQCMVTGDTDCNTHEMLVT